jgi:ABC-2 type transport system ATP-binding protein
MMNTIEITGLTYRFAGREPVLNQLDMQVPEGSVYGFLGANGAGKTTTIRLLLGLLRRQEGEIRLLGQSLQAQRKNILRQTGAMIETPSLYPHLTATENLLVLQRVYQCPVTRIGEVLEMTGLGQTGRKLAGRFSLGMKQRLGIAMAMLHQPRLLVLDEPTNGLDPAGILDMRDLLTRLNRQGVTILVSSHLLAEIERLATHVGILHGGQLRFQGSLEALKAKQLAAASTGYLTSNPEATCEVFKAQGLPTVHTPEGQVLIPVTSRETVGQLTAQLHDHRIAIYEVCTVHNDLESIFMNLTQN